MPLVLHLTPNDPSLGEGPARRVELVKRLTIGRGPDNDLVLLDPNRYLSKTHCVIDVDGDRCTITDTSTNGVFVGSGADRLPRGTPTPLVDGSVLRIGGYRVTLTAAFASALHEPDGRPASPTAAPAVAAIDDGLFGDPLAAPMMPHGSGPGTSSAGAEGLHAGGQLIPDDFDPLADDAADDAWHRGSQPDHAPADNAYFAPPKVTMETLPDDWDVGGAPPGSRSAAAARRDEPPRAAPGAMPSTPRAPALDSGDGAALASFLAAAGLSGTKLSEPEKLRLMRVAGETLQAMVKGVAEILAARASTKQEFRIERTTIGAKRNNPLKFSGSLDDAMRTLLLGRAPGFLPAKEAVDEALGDIKSHQLAVLAGMQVALTTVIGRFDPANLEDRLEQGSLLEGILPAARKARYWDLFKALYEEIATELQEDFQKVFGAEFARAYKEQLDRL